MQSPATLLGATEHLHLDNALSDVRQYSILRCHTILNAQISYITVCWQFNHVWKDICQIYDNRYQMYERTNNQICVTRLG